MTVTNRPYSRSEYAFALILLGIGVAVAVAGNLLGWNESFNWFDEILHFFMPLAAALVACMALYGKALMGAQRHPVPLVILMMLLGTGLGALWEIAEWLYTQAFTQAEVLNGKRDTMIDLILDAAGSLVGGILAVRLASR